MYIHKKQRSIIKCLPAWKREYLSSRTTDTQWRHKSKISEKLGRCGRQNMLSPYLKIWEWEWIFGCAVKAISSLGVRSPCLALSGAQCAFTTLISLIYFISKMCQPTIFKYFAFYLWQTFENFFNHLSNKAKLGQL